MLVPGAQGATLRLGFSISFGVHEITPREMLTPTRVHTRGVSTLPAFVGAAMVTDPGENLRVSALWHPRAERQQTLRIAGFGETTVLQAVKTVYVKQAHLV